MKFHSAEMLFFKSTLLVNLQLTSFIIDKFHNRQVNYSGSFVRRLKKWKKTSLSYTSSEIDQILLSDKQRCEICLNWNIATMTANVRIKRSIWLSIERITAT